MNHETLPAQGPVDVVVGRRFAVRYSAHGMDYLPRQPEKFDLTFQEATEEVERWRGYADTVGGEAIIVGDFGCECCGGTGKIRETDFIDGDEYSCMTCNGCGR